MIIGGVKVPFLLSASFVTADDRSIVFNGEFDTFGEAKAALEKFILSHPRHVDDYKIEVRYSGLLAGDIVKYPTKGWASTPHGTWAITWTKEDEE